ncbi:hypothetical protein LTR33_019431, partial [Friedmanniomyces endolithicus]
MALTQSMVSLRAPAPTSTPTPTPKNTLAVDEKGDGDGALEKQLRQLREQVARDAEEKRKIQTHAERQARELRKWDV